MNHAQASRIVESLHDWTPAQLLEVYRRVSNLEWAARAIRSEADLRELVVALTDDDDVLLDSYELLEEHFGERLADETAEGLSHAWLRACVLDGWCATGILSRLQQCKAMETISQTVAVGLRPIPTSERRVLRSDLEHMVGRLPHPIETMPGEPATYDVPGPYVVEQEEAERQRLERSTTVDASRKTEQAQARLAAYRACYERLISVRFDRVVPFVLGRVRQGDDSRGMHRRLREHEWQQATERAHAIATEHAEAVKTAALNIPLEVLVRQREFWSLHTADKPLPNVFADVCRPLTQAILELIEDMDLEARPLSGCVDHLGTHEALCILSAARWEHADTAPFVPELRDLRYAASWVSESQYQLAMRADASGGWLRTWIDRLRGGQ